MRNIGHVKTSDQWRHVKFLVRSAALRNEKQRKCEHYPTIIEADGTMHCPDCDLSFMPCDLQ